MICKEIQLLANKMNSVVVRINYKVFKVREKQDVYEFFFLLFIFYFESP